MTPTPDTPEARAERQIVELIGFDFSFGAGFTYPKDAPILVQNSSVADVRSAIVKLWDGWIAERAARIGEREEEKNLRKLLWLRHGCSFHALYGDDGEMQCNQCGIDFKRFTADQIETKWIKINEPAIAAALQSLKKETP